MSPEEVSADLHRVGGTVETLVGAASPDPADGEYVSCKIGLSDGTAVSVAYWRLSRGGVAVFSSFDHGKARVGAAIDAVAELRESIVGERCEHVAVDAGSGDLLVTVTGGLELRAFRFRSLYEDWEVSLPDGTAYWSNHVAL